MASRARLKIVNTQTAVVFPPDEANFPWNTPSIPAPNWLRLAKKSLATGHISNFQTAPKHSVWTKRLVDRTHLFARRKISRITDPICDAAYLYKAWFRLCAITHRSWRRCSGRGQPGPRGRQQMIRVESELERFIWQGKHRMKHLVMYLFVRVTDQPFQFRRLRIFYHARCS